MERYLRGLGPVAYGRGMWGRRGPAPRRLSARDVVATFDSPAGAYVHVPFCEWICPFCPYNKVRAEASLADRYFAALGREVDVYVAAYQSRFGGPFTSLYVGGGTPTLYPERLAELVARIPVAGELAIEVLPRTGLRSGSTSWPPLGSAP